MNKKHRISYFKITKTQPYKDKTILKAEKPNKSRPRRGKLAKAHSYRAVHLHWELSRNEQMVLQEEEDESNH